MTHGRGTLEDLILDPPIAIRDVQIPSDLDLGNPVIEGRGLGSLTHAIGDPGLDQETADIETQGVVTQSHMNLALVTLNHVTHRDLKIDIHETVLLILAIGTHILLLQRTLPRMTQDPKIPSQPGIAEVPGMIKIAEVPGMIKITEVLEIQSPKQMIPNQIVADIIHHETRSLRTSKHPALLLQL